jgi:hypothetical protein
MTKFVVWLKGLAAALLGGAIASVAQAAASGSINSAKLKVSAITGAALTIGAYLTQSPVTSTTQPPVTPPKS